jgi:hypothetical protein
LFAGIDKGVSILRIISKLKKVVSFLISKRKNEKNVYRLGEKGDLDEKLGKKRMGNDERKES